jgi:hypothetical protein
LDEPDSVRLRVVSNVFGDFHREKTVRNAWRGVEVSVNLPVKANGSVDVEWIFSPLIKVGQREKVVKLDFEAMILWRRGGNNDEPTVDVQDFGTEIVAQGVNPQLAG